MQLRKIDSPLRLQLALASCALMSTPTTFAATSLYGDSSADKPVQVDSGVLYYQESGGRVQVIEPVVDIKNDFGDDRSLTTKLIFDTLSGGSPNGAIPSKSVQTFATPSGTSLQPSSSSSNTTKPAAGNEGSDAALRALTYTTASGRVVSTPNGSSTSAPTERTHPTVYTVQPGELPLDTTFADERIALSTVWQQPISAADRFSLGAAASSETDFRSFSINSALAHDFNRKNTTLSAGLNLEHDDVLPVGGAPVPLSDYTLFEKTSGQSKNVVDALIGVTQVFSRHWLSQLNYSIDKSSGYQNDPYKILSAIDRDGNLISYVYENRPDSRQRNSIYWENKFALTHDVFDISYRHMNDDWGIRSNTVDVRYRLELNRQFFIEPHARWYQQTGADFFHFYLMQGDPFVPYASSDPRLAQFDAKTVGLKFGYAPSRTQEFTLRVEQYSQTGNGPNNVPTQLQGLDLYPGLKAIIVQAGFRFEF